MVTYPQRATGRAERLFISHASEDKDFVGPWQPPSVHKV